MPSIWDKILPADLVGQVVKAVSDHIPIPLDQNEKAKLDAAIEQALIVAMGQQAEINKVEAASPKLFVSGWRPFIGWTCGAAICYSFILYPVLLSCGVKAAAVDMASLWPLVIGMLGVGTMRSYEKVKGVQDKH